MRETRKGYRCCTPIKCFLLLFFYLAGMVEQWGATQPDGNVHLAGANTPVFQEYDFNSSDSSLAARNIISL